MAFFWAIALADGAARTGAALIGGIMDGSMRVMRVVGFFYGAMGKSGRAEERWRKRAIVSTAARNAVDGRGDVNEMELSAGGREARSCEIWLNGGEIDGKDQIRSD